MRYVRRKEEDSMNFSIKPATRTGIIPLIGAYGESGTGKTMSALLLARGLAGPNGKVVVIDSEFRRASLYADVIPGGYDALDFEAPFSPARYIEAMSMAFDSGAAVVVVDSFSHEHEGPGGVLEMASEAESRSGKPGLHNWRIPKMEHAKLVQFLLRAPVPVICCIRAKHKTRQIKDERGKTVIVKDDYTSPIQAEDFVYELTAHFETLPDHSIHLTKVSHPTLRECFPASGPITTKHGELIAQWCQNPGKSPTAQPTAARKRTPIDECKTRLWKLMEPYHKSVSTPAAVQKVEAQLVQWNILPMGQTLSSLTTVEQYQEVIDKVELSLQPA